MIPTKITAPPTLPVSDVNQLRTRIDNMVSQLGSDWQTEEVARALVAKACDISLEAKGVPSTTWMLSRALDLLGGRWGPSSIELFITVPNR